MSERKISQRINELSDANIDARDKRTYIDMDQLFYSICENEDTISNLSQVEIMQACKILKDMATELIDVKHLKSVCGDPIAQEKKYHPRCRTGVHNKI